jgi:ribosomal-protein-alanine N-acetyltransferase
VDRPPIPRIETARLLLREWQDRDLEPFAALNADARVMEHFVSPLTRAESDALAARLRGGWATHGYGHWAVERRSDGRFIGFVGLALWAFDAPFMPAVEIGWRLVPDAWGQGFATEAANAALEFGFERAGLDEILSWTTVSNVRSRALMERIGMVRDPSADFEHPNIPVGHPIRPHVVYRLSRADWLARQTASTEAGSTGATSG